MNTLSYPGHPLAAIPAMIDAGIFFKFLNMAIIVSEFHKIFERTDRGTQKFQNEDRFGAF